MAELILKIASNGPDPLPQDGDIVSAWNDRAIKQAHAEIICHKKGIFNSHGLRAVGTVLEDYYENTHQYKFERINTDEVRRVDIQSGVEAIMGSTPKIIDGRSQHIHGEEFIERRRKHPQHVIFGTEGMEYWYGGRVDVSHFALDKIWTAIESKTGLLRSDHKYLSLSNNMTARFLCIEVDDFDDIERQNLMSPIRTNDGSIKKYRKHFVDWRNIDWTEIVGGSSLLAAPSRNEIADKTKVVDLRGKVNAASRSIIVTNK